MAVKGRRLMNRPGIGSNTTTAILKCSSCGFESEVRMGTLMPPDQIDRKFIQRGWRIDPNKCPTCAAKPKESPMATTPSPGATKAFGKIFALLSQHFDTENGRYVTGWDDGKIAKETGMAPDVVIEFRRESFGEIREPAELALIRADINSLEQLDREHRSTVATEIAGLRGRLAEATKKLGIPA
ncbi:hypothetical protein [Rhizorhabdus sp.]|uniref:hypothetical protein n=1 Tax=Rhizorhabdus sp. TaxID=1968843 RepID=UPI00199321F7|nr:hypothetical protein [Rhizorhabdus sp.]MBD3762621.1 hypothetical protein [Rhizorhabdus sp.]